MKQAPWLGGKLTFVLRLCAVDCSKKIGDIWEDVGNNPKEVREMDEHNNAVGRTIGKDGGDCEQGCEEALDDGRLITLN